MTTKNSGYIDNDELRDRNEPTGLTQIDIYEDVNIKNRAIGFIWPKEKRIITNET